METSNKSEKTIVKEKYICPICNKGYEFALKTWQDENKKWHCEHDTPSKDKTSIKRHANYEASMEALRMANIARRENPLEEESVISTQSGSQGKTEKIPVKVIESMKEKITPLLEEE